MFTFDSSFIFSLTLRCFSLYFYIYYTYVWTTFFLLSISWVLLNGKKEKKILFLPLILSLSQCCWLARVTLWGFPLYFFIYILVFFPFSFLFDLTWYSMDVFFSLLASWNCSYCKFILCCCFARQTSWLLLLWAPCNDDNSDVSSVFILLFVKR